MFNTEKLPENSEVQIKDFTVIMTSGAIRKYSKELNDKSRKSDRAKDPKDSKDLKDTKMLRDCLQVEDLNTIN